MFYRAVQKKCCPETKTLYYVELECYAAFYFSVLGGVCLRNLLNHSIMKFALKKKSNYGKNPYQMVSQTKHPKTTVWFLGLRKRMAPSKPVNKCLLFLEHTVPYLPYRDIPLLLRNVSVGAYGVPFLAFLYWSQFRLIFLSVCALFP